MITRTCAKINLGLNIVGKRPDGYHNLQTVFYPVPICDDIEIRERPGACCHALPSQKCTLSVSGVDFLGDPGKNIVVKAYQLLALDFQLPPVHISLHKCVPIQAGMGGGSADGAFTLKLLNEMFQLGLTYNDLVDYAEKLGADCPFFIKAEPAYAEGIGELLTPIYLDLSCYQLAIVKPPLSISTREAFAGISISTPSINCREIVSQPLEVWKTLLINDFESSIFPHHPELPVIKQTLYKAGAIYAAMSGSGSAFFGIFKQVPDSFHHLFPSNYICFIL